MIRYGYSCLLHLFTLTSLIALSVKELCQCLVLEDEKVNHSKTKGPVPDFNLHCEKSGPNQYPVV